MPEAEFPRVGLGVIIVNKEGRILIGKRKNSIAPKYSIPGGHLEAGETFESGAAREVKEETGLDISSPKVIGVTNNLETFRAEGRHYVSVVLLATEYSGELKNMEPDKCDGFLWADPGDLPQPHFDASRLAVSCYLNRSVYEGEGS